MSRDAARQGLLAKLETLMPGMANVQVELPNKLAIDPAKATSPFLRVDIVFPASMQGSLGAPNHLRVQGQMIFEAWINNGAGTKIGNDILEYFAKPFSATDSIPGARCQAVNYGRSYPKTGWRVEPAIIPFWFDDFD